MLASPLQWALGLFLKARSFAEAYNPTRLMVVELEPSLPKVLFFPLGSVWLDCRASAKLSARAESVADESITHHHRFLHVESAPTNQLTQHWQRLWRRRKKVNLETDTHMTTAVTEVYWIIVAASSNEHRNEMDLHLKQSQHQISFVSKPPQMYQMYNPTNRWGVLCRWTPVLSSLKVPMRVQTDRQTNKHTDSGCVGEKWEIEVGEERWELKLGWAGNK